MINHLKNLLPAVILLVSAQLFHAQNNWYAQTTPITDHLKDIIFIDYKTGWAVGEYGKIIHTIDGGYHWLEQTSGIASDLFAVHFTDSQNGWAVGEASKILHTIDGGATWTDESFGSGTLNDVFFTHPDTGFIVGENGIFRRTYDGGNTWTEDNEPSLLTVNACYFEDGQNGLVATMSGRVQSTNDGGLNWTLHTTGTTWSLFDIIRTNNYIYAVGDYGTILFSDNNGSTWTTQTSGTTNILGGIAFADDNTGWVVGNQGLVLYTEDAGITWIEDISNTTEPLYAATLINHNLVWSVGATGTIIKKDFTEKICIVLVDSTVNKNKIVWERIHDQGTAYYNIYKLSGTQYDSIGTVLYDDMSEFIDYYSTPDQNSDRYKITTVDSFGNESALSPYMQTINLSSLQGVPSTTITLLWNHFEDESGQFIPNYYYIYRGTLPYNMVLYDSISSAFNTKDYPNQTVVYYYYVSVDKPDACVPTSSAKINGGPYSQSVSNLEDNGICNPGAIPENQGYLPLSIYPNPASETVTISFPNEMNNDYCLMINDLTGKNILKTQIINNHYILDINQFASGIYYLDITCSEPVEEGDKNYKGKLVIE
ncbi:MAG: YCF48-related protein [Bacteroidota bacterium]